MSEPVPGFESVTIEFMTKESVSASISTFMGQPSSVSYTQVTDTESTATDPPNGEVARGVDLHQNYPNPFNPTTTITYDLPQAASVRLTVSDVLGRQVAVLADGRQVAGSHQIAFNAVGLPTGVYLYRLEVGGQVQTRRMLLVK